MAGTRSERQGHWLTLESAASGAPWGCRVDSVGVKLPAQRLTTKDLISKTSHSSRIQLERLTGIHERRIVGPGENSFTLATGAARDCLAHSRHRASGIEMLVSASITRSKGRFSQSSEPPLSLSVKQAIGAAQAVNFDLPNACAGMLTGVFILQDFIARGEISCGMIVSGEYISHLSWNAARQIRSVFTFLRPAGGAILLSWRDDLPGFTGFGTETFPEYEDLFTGGLVWRERHGIRVPRHGTGRNTMVVTVKPGYRARLADCAEEATRRFLRRLDLEVRDVSLLVAAPSDPDFLDPLRARLGIPGDLHHRAHRRTAGGCQVGSAGRGPQHSAACRRARGHGRPRPCTARRAP